MDLEQRLKILYRQFYLAGERERDIVRKDVKQETKHFADDLGPACYSFKQCR